MEVMRDLLRACGRIKENAKAHGMLNNFLKLTTVIGEVGTVIVLIQKWRLRNEVIDVSKVTQLASVGFQEFGCKPRETDKRTGDF